MSFGFGGKLVVAFGGEQGRVSSTVAIKSVSACVYVVAEIYQVGEVLQDTEDYRLLKDFPGPLASCSDLKLLDEYTTSITQTLKQSQGICNLLQGINWKQARQDETALCCGRCSI